MGCVGQAGEQTFADRPQRRARLQAPDSVPAVTIDRQCGSSQQAIHFAAQAVMSGTQDMVIAAGVESMTRVPMGSPITLADAAGSARGRSRGIRSASESRASASSSAREMIAKK